VSNKTEQIINQARAAAAFEKQLSHERQDLTRQIKTFTHEGIDYRITKDGELAKLPKVEYGVLEAATLQGIVDYVKNDPDDADIKHFIQILSPHSVVLYGPASKTDKSRQVFVSAGCVDRSQLHRKNEQFHTQEAFAVWLMTAFKEGAGDYDYVRQAIGKIKSDKVAESMDTGFAQVVSIKNGVQSENVEVKNPVKLFPIRSFPEIEPIEQPFVLRLQQASEDNQPPSVALFDADNGGWAVEAVARIKQWLAAKLPETTIIG